MMNPETLAIGFGLGSAIAWGAGDFSGGFATKKDSVFIVIFLSQLIGALLLLGLQLLFSEQAPEAAHFLWGGAGGLCGTFGLVALYKGLATGRMGIVAPVSAVVTALIPIGFAWLVQGMPKGTQLLGFGAALVAVWLFSASRGPTRIVRSELSLSVLAGVGFGLFFICIDRVSSDAILGPLLAARMTSIAFLAVMMLVGRRPKLPSRSQLPFIVMAGILDTAGNAFFALASQVGRLDISAVLASMYPVSTVLLARVILKECLHHRQRFGLVAACVALVLIAV